MIENKDNKTYITYQYARFFKRVMANLIDIILFLFCFGILFVSTRAIVNSTEYGKNVNEELYNIRLESGLYERVVSQDNRLLDIVSYINEFYGSASQKKSNAIGSIKKFLSYSEKVCDKKTSDEIYESYLNYFYDDELVYFDEKTNTSTPYFLKEVDDDGFVIENEECPANYLEYYENAYAPFIDNVLQGYLITAIPNYYELNKFSGDMLFYVEIPVSYLLSGILIYFVPTLIFKRGRKTFGKAIYRIGLVDKNFLNPSFGRSFARFCIFYFAELILSLFTFGIPYIISFSLMAFSKKRQGFCDYMLGLYEVDTTNLKIFYNLTDAKINAIEKPTKDIKFKNRDLT